MAIDLFDRYLDTQFGLTKDVLQRVGVTCLFTAAKIEVCIQVQHLTNNAFATLSCHVLLFSINSCFIS